jgi:hypothetical protein
MLSEVGHYTHNDKASVPWGQIAKDTSDWLGVDSWPRDVDFKDPSKLQLMEAQRVFQHWTERQKNREVVVEFKKAGAGHMKLRGQKGKATWREVNDSHAGMMDSDEEEVHPDMELPTPGPSLWKGKKKEKKHSLGQVPASVFDNSKRHKFLSHLSANTAYVELLQCLTTLPVSHLLTYLYIQD